MSGILLSIGEGFGRDGGIERFNRLIIRGLSEYALQNEIMVWVHSKNDNSSSVDLRYFPEHVKLSFVGHKGNTFCFIYGMVKCAIQNRPDLMIMNHVNFAPLGLFFRKMAITACYAISIYGIEIWRGLPLIKRLGFRYADMIISISEYSKQISAEINGVDLSKIQILPPTLDPFWQSADYLPALKLSEIDTQKCPKILSVARLCEADNYKGLDTVIHALPSIIDRIGPVSYTIVGDGDDRLRLEKIVRELNLNETVCFLGRVEPEKLENIYANCDLFVLPSKNEGFGIVFLEAMSYAKPVIGGRFGGTPEVIADGETGYLVLGFEDLVDRICQLASDAALRKKMGEAGLKRLNEHFTYSTFRYNLFKLLDNLQANCKGKSPLN